MDKEQTIVITGAAGFIGSCLVSLLNQSGYARLVLVDDFSNEAKSANLSGKQFIHKIHRDQFEAWCKENPGEIGYFFHLGARTDTTEQDYAVLKKLNLDYSQWIWNFCAANHIPLVYASSAATYGNGAWGYKEDTSIIPRLRPLNAYGVSKNEFDIWALRQSSQPPFWAGLKFFNVYGPNEYHKGRMASVIFHAFNQIREGGQVKLFRSHHPGYEDGGQLRDFIYVKDVIRVCIWLMDRQPSSGIYNLGTGKARSFRDLAAAVFRALSQPENIAFIDTPADIRDKYQYFTQADMHKLRHAGYRDPFFSLEEGISDYVENYLAAHSAL